MELRVLRYFPEVAREGSITHAAQRLHISQPTLSRQLKELEEELGKKLFIRGNYNVRLTDEGMLLRKRAEDILDMVGKTEEEFRSLGCVTGGDVRIGCAESEGICHLARRLRSLQQRYPGIRFHLFSGDRGDLAERLDRGLLDFAVLVEAVDLVRYNYLALPGADTWGLIMPQDHPLAQKEHIQPQDLMDLPLICPRQGLQQELSRWFGNKVTRLNIVSTINLAYNGSILAREGLGCVLTFDRLIDVGPDSGLCFRPLFPALHSKLYWVWKKYQVFSPAAELLLEEMRQPF